MTDYSASLLAQPIPAIERETRNGNLGRSTSLLVTATLGRRGSTNTPNQVDLYSGVFQLLSVFWTYDDCPLDRFSVFVQGSLFSSLFPSGLEFDHLSSIFAIQTYLN